MPIYIINHEETTMLLFQFLLGCVYNIWEPDLRLCGHIMLTTHNTNRITNTIYIIHFREIQILKI